MTDDFEQALRRALRRKAPGEEFARQILSRVDADAERASVVPLDSRRLRGMRSRWLPAALAAGIVAGLGFVQMRQHAIDAARANQARAQLLQALSIASENINIVRAAVAREENPDS